MPGRLRQASLTRTWASRSGLVRAIAAHARFSSRSCGGRDARPGDPLPGPARAAAFAVGDGGIRLEALRRLVELHRGRPEEVHFLIDCGARSGAPATRRSVRLGDEILAMKTAPLGRVRRRQRTDLRLPHHRRHGPGEAALRTAESLRDEHLKAGETRRGAARRAIVEYARANCCAFPRVTPRPSVDPAIARTDRQPAGIRTRASRDDDQPARGEPRCAQLHRRRIRENPRRHGRNVEAESMAAGLQDAARRQTLGTRRLLYGESRRQDRAAPLRRGADGDRPGLDCSPNRPEPDFEGVLTLRIFRLQSLLGSSAGRRRTPSTRRRSPTPANDAVRASRLAAGNAGDLHALNAAGRNRCR